MPNQKYRVPATRKTPALIIYLLAMGASMGQRIGGKTKSEVVTEALQKVAVKMVQRSTKGRLVSPRYRIAMFAYSTQVTDLLGGVKTIDQLAKTGIPRITPPSEPINTAAAFREAEGLLNWELPRLQHCPAPLICHIVDTEYAGPDPEPVARRIMEMSVPDGNVLIENVYVAPVGLSIPDVTTWPGISSEEELTDPYARKLFRMSSPIPKSYLNVMREFGYSVESGARMFLPGEEPDLVEFGFAMSGVSVVTKG